MVKRGVRGRSVGGEEGVVRGIKGHWGEVWRGGGAVGCWRLIVFSFIGCGCSSGVWWVSHPTPCGQISVI